MASSEINLRPYRPADFEALYLIDQACFPRGIVYGPNELKIYLRSKGAHCLVAEARDEVAGYILTERSAETAHIITLDVLEAHRRRGVGSGLLAAAEGIAALEGVQRIYLETATTNDAAIALWKKHGYRELAVVASYYGHGLDAFRMQKLLEMSALDKVSP